MTHHDPPELIRALTQLDDQWLAFTESCAFTCEAMNRLLQDHPHLTTSVVQGAERQTTALRKDAERIGLALEHVRQLIHSDQNASH